MGGNNPLVRRDQAIINSMSRTRHRGCQAAYSLTLGISVLYGVQGVSGMGLTVSWCSYHREFDDKKDEPDTEICQSHDL